MLKIYELGFFEFRMGTWLKEDDMKVSEQIAEGLGCRKRRRRGRSEDSVEMCL